VRKPIKPHSVVVVIDSTFYGRTYGIMVVRVPKLKTNIYWHELIYETIADYQAARIAIEDQGWQIQAVALDGRSGARNVFADLPVQMCHYHQKAIINRYLTMRPKLDASLELRNLTTTLTKTNEPTFNKELNRWYEKWSSFLKERTIDELNPNKWHYTHSRLRSAYRSLKTNLPYLFTYQNYPALEMPNTTNCLDGFFAHLKELTKLHRGLNKEIKRKMIEEILSKSDPQI
jgi:hypothetical protein